MDATMQSLDVFHLKGLRTILRLNTTSVNGANSNERVYQVATDAMHGNGYTGEPLQIMSAYAEQQKPNRIAKLLIRAGDKGT